MFMHVFKYRLKCLIRDRDTLFWTMAFPILLATMFYFAFGDLIGSNGGFEPVRVAVVNSSEYRSNTHLQLMLGVLSTPGEDQLLNMTLTTESEAERLLDEGRVAGVITVSAGEGFGGSGSSPVRLTVTSSGLGQSILKAILDEYLHTSATAVSVLSQGSVDLSEFIARLRSRGNYTQQISYSDALPDSMLAYFYALVAMAALYASFWGVRNTMDIQADLSDKGARRSVAPTHKLTVVMGDWTASLLISFGEMLILIAYLVFALRVDFGDQIGYVLLTCLAGCIAGLSFGTVIGTLFRKSEGAKIATLVASSNLMSFLAGLMYLNMKDIVARKAPVLSYINPAALISDAFYSLYIFDNHNRFFLNISLLCVFSAVMCLISYLRLRSEKYASI